MIIEEAGIEGVYIIEPERIEDERGFFARTFDYNQLFTHYINFRMMQVSISYNKKKGTLRGMHYQSTPHLENKIVQCIKGSIYDVVLDIRDYSKTYKKWVSVGLCDENNKLLFIPANVAHGFQTLEDDTTVMYIMDRVYDPDGLRVVNYKSCGIEWPLEPSVILDKDKGASFV